MNGELRTLIRKDLRAMRGTYIAVAILLGIAVWLLPTARTIHFLSGKPWIVAPFFGAILSAFLGAGTFADEKQRGTIHFLVGLPVDRRHIWRSKLATTAPVALLVALLLAVYPVAGAVDLNTSFWQGVALLALFVFIGLLTCALLYSFGILFSLIVDTVVIATLGAIALFTILAGGVSLIALGILNRYPNMSHVAQGIVFAALASLGLALAALALLLARRIFCGKAQEG